MAIQYTLLEGLPDGGLLASMLALLTEIFPDQTPADWHSDLQYHQSRSLFLTLLAVENEQVIGCKLGYERKPGHFYSWLGCVRTNDRGRGLATELMRRQHDWCRAKGYHTVRTQTYNQWRGMLLLNIRQGFDIVGTVQGKHGLAIVLEKAL